jgi:hypothetical protein
MILVTSYSPVVVPCASNQQHAVRLSLMPDIYSKYMNMTQLGTQ